MSDRERNYNGKGPINANGPRKRDTSSVASVEDHGVSFGEKPHLSGLTMSAMAASNKQIGKLTEDKSARSKDGEAVNRLTPTQESKSATTDVMMTSQFPVQNRNWNKEKQCIAKYISNLSNMEMCQTKKKLVLAADFPAVEHIATNQHQASVQDQGASATISHKNDVERRYNNLSSEEESQHTNHPSSSSLEGTSSETSTVTSRLTPRSPETDSLPTQSMSPKSHSTVVNSSKVFAREKKTSYGGGTSSGDVKNKARSKKPRKEKSHLRKGKWTAEEEEYTTRVIHHFRTGLLTLPEGTTLRSYLAEKLNCDPMRITKKFAGASCLGKRVYHLCERSRLALNDIEMAKTELSNLEQLFRLRVKHGESGAPLPRSPGTHMQDSVAHLGSAFIQPNVLLPSPSSSPILTLPISTYPSNQATSATAPWLQNFVTTSSTNPIVTTTQHLQQNVAQAFGMPPAVTQLLPNVATPAQSHPQGVSPRKLHQNNTQAFAAPSVAASLLSHAANNSTLPSQSTFQNASPSSSAQPFGLPPTTVTMLSGMLLAAQSQGWTNIKVPPPPTQSFEASNQTVAALAVAQVYAHALASLPPSVAQLVAAALQQYGPQKQSAQQQSAQFGQAPSPMMAQAPDITHASLAPAPAPNFSLLPSHLPNPNPTFPRTPAPPPAAPLPSVQPPSQLPDQANIPKQPCSQHQTEITKQSIFSEEKPFTPSPKPAPTSVPAHFTPPASAPSAAIPSPLTGHINSVPKQWWAHQQVGVESVNDSCFEEKSNVTVPVQDANSTLPAESRTRVTKGRTKEDKDAGGMLLGFLSALRKGHEEAMEKARKEEEAEASAAHPLAPVVLTGNSAVVKKQALSSDSSATQPLRCDSRLPPPEGNSDKKHSSSQAGIVVGSFNGIGCYSKRSTLRTTPNLTAQLSDLSSGFSKASSDINRTDAPCIKVRHFKPSYGYLKQCSDLSGADFDNDALSGNSRSGRAVVVTDSSSSGYTDRPFDSSVGDSESSSSSGNITNSRGDPANKNDNASGSVSSDDNDSDNKDVGGRTTGPVKKRMRLTPVGEFTSKNVADHNSRMEALEGISRLAGLRGKCSDQKWRN